MRLFYLLFPLAYLGLGSSYASHLIKKEEPNFSVNYQDAQINDVYYSYKLGNPKEILAKYPEFLYLDGIKLFHKSFDRLMLAKVIAFVPQNAQDFNIHYVISPEYYQAQFTGSQITKLDSGLFHVNYSDQLQFNLSVTSDADDMSSVQNPHFINAIERGKKMTLMASSSYLSTVEQLSHFSELFYNGQILTYYIPIGSRKTMVLKYYLFSVQSPLVSEEDFIKDLKHQFFHKKSLP